MKEDKGFGGKHFSAANDVIRGADIHISMWVIPLRAPRCGEPLPHFGPGDGTVRPGILDFGSQPDGFLGVEEYSRGRTEAERRGCSSRFGGKRFPFPVCTAVVHGFASLEYLIRSCMPTTLFFVTHMELRLISPVDGCFPLFLVVRPRVAASGIRYFRRREAMRSARHFSL
jgi:hypothetical protein